MYFSKFLKGIPARYGLDQNSATAMVQRDGIVCGWWNNVKQITPQQVADKLTERNLQWHLERYSDVDPTTGRQFFENTPFLSLASGVVERDAFRSTNLLHPAFLTALQFATAGFNERGFIFYGYVITLGKKAVPFREYAEQVRELNIYTSFLRYHPEGELVAKIQVPAHRLQKVEEWDP